MNKNLKKALILSVFLTAFSLGSNAMATEQDSLARMSLEDLLNLNLDTATLTGISQLKVPASVTTITADDIRMTPARNIYDLLEIYVPGAYWVNHAEGPHPGIRGIISDRNYKFLMLVNGRNMNQKAHNGATGELDNWDIDDIERIDVIRGPGSVTYGPGAIMGVISITTKNSKTSENTKLGGRYVSSYNSFGGNFSQSVKNENIDLYLYGSAIRTMGYKPNIFSMDSSFKTGYIGKDFPSVDKSNTANLGNPPLTYFSDVDEFPQVKLYGELNFLKEWNLSARYTTMGTTLSAFLPEVKLQTGLKSDGSPELGAPIDTLNSNKYKQITLTLKNNHEFTDFFDLATMLSFYSQDYQRRVPNSFFYTKDDPVAIQQQLSDPYSLRNMHVAFGENELLVQTIANLRFAEKYKAALGAEYVYDHFGPGWFKDKDNFRMGDDKNIISGTTSTAYDFAKYNGVDPKKTEFVGDGWGSHTYSVFGEANLEFHPLMTLILGARADQNSFSKLLFSPRVALVSEFNPSNVLKLIWQNSNRMNTAEQLYQQSKANTISDPETVSGVELIYTSLLTKDLSLTGSGFYNNLNVIGWNNEKLSSVLAGNLSLAGFDVEAKYSTEMFTLGLNHSFAKEISWKLAPGIVGSGISYADFNRVIDATNKITLTGSGNDLNNWPTNSSKLFLNFNLGAITEILNPFRLHVDARIFYGWDGNKEGLNALEKAVTGTPKETDVKNMIAEIRKKDVYGIDARFNVALNYNISKNVSLTAYGMNIGSFGGNKRYTYDASISNLIPQRASFLEEPSVYGIKLDTSF